MPQESLTFAGATDVGCRRALNADAWLGSASHRLFAVAKGMDGSPRAGSASQLVVDAIRDYYDLSSDGPLERYAAYVNQDEDARRLLNGIHFAHEQLRHVAKLEPIFGTIVVALVVASVVGRRAFVACVGDCRCYWAGQGQLVQISGADRPAPARRPVPSGIAPHHTVIEPEILHMDLRPGESLLLCSGGLHNVVPEGQIRRVLARETGVVDRAKTLVDLAVALGGPDNMTALIIELG